MIEYDRMEMPAAIIKQFDLHSVNQIGDEEGFYNELNEALQGHEIHEEEFADAVFLTEYGDDTAAEYGDDTAGAIEEAFEHVNPNGFLFGLWYDHQHVEVQRSISALFPLYTVSVGPGAVWAVRKGGDANG